MIIKTPDKFMCDICSKETPQRGLKDYYLNRKASYGSAELIAEFHICYDCEPENKFFDSPKKQSLIRKIFAKFLTQPTRKQE